VAVERPNRLQPVDAAREPEGRDFSSLFHLAFRQARAIGVRLRLRTEFEALAQVFAKYRTNWPELFPVFDPAYHDFSPASAVWIQGLDESGETVSTYAARALYWPDTTLGAEARSLRLFFGDPASQAAAGDFAEIPETPAVRINGRTACVGALWVRPDHRGIGLTRIVSRLCKAYVFARWQASTCFAFVDPAHFMSGVARAFGTIEARHGVRLRLCGRDLPASLTYQTGAAVLADIARAVRRGEIESSRRTETTLTKESAPERCQGMAKR
jgi:GNAT superfamily N-acetyltransferase